MTLDFLSLATTCVLGVFAGSLFTEAFLLLPYWRRLDTETFYALHHEFGPRLYRYFAPLTGLATVLAIVLAVRALPGLGPPDLFAWLSAGLIVAVTLTFPLYFKAANQAFVDRRFNATELPKALRRWAAVHNFRTLLALLGFAAAAVGLANGP